MFFNPWDNLTQVSNVRENPGARQVLTKYFLFPITFRFQWYSSILICGVFHRGGFVMHPKHDSLGKWRTVSINKDVVIYQFNPEF